MRTTQYVISWAVGYVTELLMPEDIDKKKYGFWRLETLPIIPKKFELKPKEDSKEIFDRLKKLIARKDIKEIINACDAGREGEHIFNQLCELAKNKHPVKRLWLQSMMPQAIREGFQNLRDGSEMAGLADAARSRSESDWLIGINGTRAITKRMFGSRGRNVASVGRVQTPTLAIVYARELEIRNFKPHDYWRVTAKFEIAQGEYEGIYQRPNFKRNGDEHDRIDRIWDQDGGGSGCRRVPGPADRDRFRGKESQLANSAASLRPDNAATRGERPLRFFRQAHVTDRAGALRETQNVHLPAHGFPRSARRLSAGR